MNTQLAGVRTGGETQESKAVMLMMIDVQPEYEVEFNRWYNEEHLPELMALPGFLSARRFEVEGEGHKYLAIYELEDSNVFDTAEYKTWREASESTRRMSTRFVSRSRRVYREIFSAKAALK